MNTSENLHFWTYARYLLRLITIENGTAWKFFEITASLLEARLLFLVVGAPYAIHRLKSKQIEILWDHLNSLFLYRNHTAID